MRRYSVVVLEREVGDVAPHVGDPLRPSSRGRRTRRRRRAIHDSVIETIAIASAAALITGITLGSGMCTSSPTGGAARCSRLLAHPPWT